MSHKLVIEKVLVDIIEIGIQNVSRSNFSIIALNFFILCLFRLIAKRPDPHGRLSTKDLLSRKSNCLKRNIKIGQCQHMVKKDLTTFF